MDSRQEERLRKKFPHQFAGQIANNLELKYANYLKEKDKPPEFYTWSKCAQKSVANLNTYLRQYLLPKAKDPLHEKWNVCARVSTNRLNAFYRKPREKISLEWQLQEFNSYASLPPDTLKYEYRYKFSAKIETYKLNNLKGTAEDVGRNIENYDWNYSARRNCINLNSFSKKSVDPREFKWKRAYVMNEKELFGFKNPEWDEKVISICANLNRIASEFNSLETISENGNKSLNLEMGEEED
ncbi:hypothetical protein CH352_00805 [Leptospira hartskeerlii]|uniref:Uncharacterized protein n=1 Tax=Leptospira hartskeerlii TaxID=2023177 RepID=A0A2M9X890_9LEPT|nr:hypothetical protein [Leptospira hartskeerlii]PJZ23907.1 hypothetical protein CH357_18730 [Leptospira hartskeerlii]PJZ35208.1 hypothetical protein CH352_00805 [Leptospira hartskeerlii]